MENFSPIEEEEKQLIFTEKIISDLKVSSRWGSFISIFTVSLMVLSIVFYFYFISKLLSQRGETIGSLFESFPFQLYLILMILIGFFILYVLSFVALWNFSMHMKKAIELKSSITLETAINELFKFFRYNGIIGLAVIFFAILLFFEIYPFSRTL